MNIEQLKFDVLERWKIWPDSEHYDELDEAIGAFVDGLKQERPDIYFSGHLGHGQKYRTIWEWVHDYERQ